MIDRKEINAQIQVAVDRSDLIYLNRVLDSAYSIIEAVAAEGDEDDSLILELDEISAIVKEYLNRK